MNAQSISNFLQNAWFHLWQTKKSAIIQSSVFKQYFRRMNQIRTTLKQQERIISNLNQHLYLTKQKLHINSNQLQLNAFSALSGSNLPKNENKINRKKLGAHLSISKSLAHSVKTAIDLNLQSIALFLKNSHQYETLAYNNDEIRNFKQEIKRNNFNTENILPHSNYLINLGNPTSPIKEKSINSLIHEINKADQLGLKYLVLHPGSNVQKIPQDDCFKLIAQGLSEALQRTSNNITILLENTAGSGNQIGWDFSHLQQIKEMVLKGTQQDRIKFCLDTCHMFAAGYPLNSQENYLSSMNKFSQTCGFENLKGVHLNDSAGPLGCKTDRHEAIGKGFIGRDFFQLFMNDERFDNIPCILELPLDQALEGIQYLNSL